MKKILIIEDDISIADIEKDYLEANGYEVELVHDGLKAMDKFNQYNPDLVLLDLMLPGKDGFELCHEMRKIKEVPILMVTAKTSISDKVLGLGLGADDFITKPFDPSELVARVKAHLSRFDRLVSKVEKDEDVIEFGNIKINLKSHEVFKNNEEIKMPVKEFELLHYLASQPNVVFSKEKLFEDIWGFDYLGDSATVTVHINRVREKIEDNPSKPRYIETVWGAGYKFKN